MNDMTKNRTSDWTRAWVRALLIMVGYYCLLRMGYAMASFSNLPIISPAFGLAFASILIVGRSAVPLLFLADFLAQLSLQSSPLQSFSISMVTVSVGNILGMALGVEVLRMVLRGQSVFDAPRHVLLFLLAAIPAASSIAMLGHLSMFMLNNMLWDANLSPLIAVSLISSAIGIMVIGSLILAFAEPSGRDPARMQPLEIIAVFAACLLIAWLLMGTRFPEYFSGYPLELLYLPVVLVAAVRLDSRRFTSLVALFAILILTGMIQRPASNTGGYLHETLLPLQCFLGAIVGTVLILHAFARQSCQLLIRTELNRIALDEMSRALDKKKSQQYAELQHERQRLRCILDTSPEPYAFVTPQWLISEVNGQLCRISDYPRSELQTLRLSELIRFPSQTDPCIHPWPDTMDSMTIEATLIQKSGGRLPVQAQLGRLSNGEQLVGYILFISDLSPQHLARTLSRDIQRVNQLDFKPALEQIVKAVRELRTASGSNPMVASLLDRIENEHRQIRDSVNRSLELLRMETGQSSLRSEPVDLIEMIRGIIQDFQPDHPGMRINLYRSETLATAADTFVVEGDASFLRLMLSNLLCSSLDAAPAQSELQIHLGEDDQRYNWGAFTIALHHQGVIAHGVRDDFWEKYAGEPGDPRRGLCAFHVRLIAEAHGGQVNFISSESHGTTLNVLLPRSAPARQ